MARPEPALVRHEARTLLLRAPYADYPALAGGYKTEFRSAPLGAIAFNAPTPVVLYAVAPRRGRTWHQLMVLADHHRERLFDISEDKDALDREGFGSYAEFCHYWRRRTRKGFQPLDEVDVFRLAPWTSTSSATLGPVLIERLYGEYM